MHTSRMIMMGLAAASLALTGCTNTMQQENALLMEENQVLREELNSRNAALEAANLDLRDRTLQVSQLRRDLENSQTVTMPRETPFDQIPGVTGSYGAGVVTAVVESDILFDSGKVSLKSTAKRALDGVANIIKSSYPGQVIQITGYTDIDPIKKSGHASNYHLGFKRAYAVRDYLISRGVESKLLSLATYGPDKPMENKAKSRRVEIAILLQS